MNYEQKLERAKQKLLACAPEDPDACWEMPNAGSGTYPQIKVDWKVYYAYRLSYELFVGPIPDGMDLDHECHNRAVAAGECVGGDCAHRRCVNPAHLAPKSRRGNLLASPATQASINSAKTHCKRGHEFTPENTGHRNGTQWRYCRTCSRMAKEERAEFDRV